MKIHWQTGAGQVEAAAYGLELFSAGVTSQYSAFQIQAGAGTKIQLLSVWQAGTDDERFIFVQDSDYLTTTTKTYTDAEKSQVGLFGTASTSVVKAGSSTTNPNSGDLNFWPKTATNVHRNDLLDKVPFVIEGDQRLCIAETTANQSISGLAVWWLEF